jgi:AcrR family transcriptional regulator
MPDDTTFQRARRPEQKLQRREAILDAARALALRGGVRNVTLTDIAAKVGIHKSALLRYFETREQLFLELTARSWRDWLQALSADLKALSAEPRRHDRPERVAAAIARSFDERPLLCDLIAHTPLNLERHASVGAVREYKLTSLGSVQQAAAAIQSAVPELSLEQSYELIATIATLAGSVWQIANPPALLAELYASDPALAGACVELGPRLQRTATVLLRGYAATRPDQSS